MFFSRMYTSGSHFYLLFQVICYIVPTSAGDCDIPPNGYICEDEKSGELVSAISIGGVTRRMKCDTWSNEDTKMIPISVMIDLEPTGIGEWCDDFLYVFKDGEIYISRRIRLPRNDDRPEINEQEVSYLSSYPNQGIATWRINISRTGRAGIYFPRWPQRRGHLVESSPAQVEFHTADKVYAPRPFKEYIDSPDIPFKLHLSGRGNVVLTIKPSEVEEFNTNTNWDFGYEQLQLYGFQFIKTGGELRIRVGIKKTYEEPPVSVA